MIRKGLRKAYIFFFKKEQPGDLKPFAMTGPREAQIHCGSIFGYLTTLVALHLQKDDSYLGSMIS